MRRAQVILLCEDKQQEVLIRRVLSKLRGKDLFRTVPMPCGRGSGEQFVRDNFPGELKAQRTKAVTSVLVVVIDGDNIGIEGRRRQLHESCAAADVDPPKRGDRVLIAIPTRNIETWLSYLGGEDVTETDIYQRLRRPGDCRPHVDALVEMCRTNQLRPPAPSSLEAACIDYRNAFQAE